jgi:hypothetical protein
MVSPYCHAVPGFPSADNVRFTQIVDGVRAICERADDEIAARFLPLLRRVAGDNLDIFNP